jgi:hypothetical protein
MNKVIVYLNATLVKYRNKRVKVQTLDNESIGIMFKTMENINESSACHCVSKNKIKTTSLVISKEGAWGLFIALKQELYKDQSIESINN